MDSRRQVEQIEVIERTITEARRPISSIGKLVKKLCFYKNFEKSLKQVFLENGP